MGTLYLIRSGNTAYYKVGVTKQRIQARMSTLQVGNPELLYLIKTYKLDASIMYDVERMIHASLSEHYYRAEWFRFHTPEHARHTVDINFNYYIGLK